MVHSVNHSRSLAKISHSDKSEPLPDSRPFVGSVAIQRLVPPLISVSLGDRAVASEKIYRSDTSEVVMRHKPDDDEAQPADNAVDDAWHRIVDSQTITDIDAATIQWQELVAAESANREQ